jgi:hypothetical protein
MHNSYHVINTIGLDNNVITYQVRISVIATLICTFNRATTVDKQEVRREGNEVTSIAFDLVYQGKNIMFRFIV